MVSRPKRQPEGLVFARKVALEVSFEDALHLDGQSKICNRLYNDLLERANSLRVAFVQAKENGNEALARDIARILYTDRGLRDLVPEMKQEHPFFRAVYSSPLKNAALRLSRAIADYQDSVHGRRKGPKMGWPIFKAWKREWFSVEYEEPGKGWKIEDGNWLRLSFGENAEGKRMSIRLRLIDPPKGLRQARNVRIAREAGRYYALFGTEEKRGRMAERRDGRFAPGNELRVLYIDPNIKNLGYGVSNHGEACEYDNCPALKELDRRIDKLKSKRDRCVRRGRLVEFTRDDGTVHRHWEPSRRWARYDRALKAAEAKKRDLVKHFFYSVGHRLFETYDVVGIGDFVPANASSGLGKKANRTIRNNRHLGRLRDTLAWVAQKSGRRFMALDETGTTRTCSACDHEVEGGIHPSVREWTCPSCHAFHIRDENAAKNGLVRLLGKLRDVGLAGNLHVPCSGPAGVEIRQRCRLGFRPGGRWEMSPFGDAPAMNQIGPGAIPPGFRHSRKGDGMGVVAADPGLVPAE